MLEGRVCFGSQGEGSVHHGGEVVRTEVREWVSSHYINSQESGEEINAAS